MHPLTMLTASDPGAIILKVSLTSITNARNTHDYIPTRRHTGVNWVAYMTDETFDFSEREICSLKQGIIFVSNIYTITKSKFQCH
jgi:hypothetical protein